MSVNILNTTPTHRLPVELTERKGLGHPDYIADAAAEASSVALSKYYLERFGVILHHNVDKVLVVGGQSNPVFGGGEVLHPIYVIVAGRATEFVNVGGSLVRIPIGTIIVSAVKEWIKRNFRFLDPDRHVVVDYMIRSGSADLVATYEAGAKSVPLANDTSFGVGFAPLTSLERLVVSIEKELNSPRFKNELPEVGEDIKVMGMRTGSKIRVTIAAALISHLIPDPDHYISVKEEIKNRMLDLAVKIAPGFDVEIDVNTADNPKLGAFYLTVTGTSAEHGDDGATGRGNRACGLITPMRRMSLEATAGKNPVSHVGKLYNVLAYRIAEKIVKEIPKVQEAYVELLSQIGKPITKPQIASISLLLENPAEAESARRYAEAIAREEISKITSLTDLIVKEQVQLF
ncbi:MAG: methionine adenosyltransferase [Sulfolobales archaeon]|nr:methionine adenosyltransferase [Sulfolobales archaeon]MDW8082479.1 methionine adenosyltransferase [Sulfolobales archaeon]